MTKTFLPPHPSLLPNGEREEVRGNFKYFWLEIICDLVLGIWYFSILEPNPVNILLNLKTSREFLTRPCR
jgi:hypothetical protein